MKLLSIIFMLTAVFISLAAAQTTISPTGEKIEGQIVCCADCWAEADRTKVEFGTAEDLLKAKSCVEGGDPTLIAVRTGNDFKLYQLEEGKFKLTEKNWLSYVGKTVAVTGSVKKRKKADVFVVDSLEVVRDSLAVREAKEAIGREETLRLKDLFGTDQSLNQYKGRIVVLNFWATFCDPCREEMPDLSEIQNEYAALGVQVIGASTDEVGDRAKILEFIKETRVNFPIWMGATAADMRRFGLGEALPGTVVIDKSGKIVKVISGIVNAAQLRKQLDSMLEIAEKSVEKVEPVVRKDAKPSKTEVSSVPS
ncbi:MAG: TlpA family protein disulfide reductase [Pyrinomonadaceae bacterium]|nr:TlpA family protein disulfide reductase [Pyrinomonadaceae bacterium]